MRVKQVYLARRHPDLSPEGFAQAWREHSELAGRFVTSLGAHFDRVRQCVKVSDAAVPPEYRNSYDGCALLDMKSWDGLWAVRNHPRAANELKSDEERVFAGYVEPWTLACESEVLRGSGEGAHGLVWFLKRNDSVEAAAFEAALRDRLLALDIAALQARGIVLDAVRERKDPPYDFAAVVELWFADANAAQTAASDDGLRRVHAALADIADLDRSVALLVRTNFAKRNIVSPQGGAVWEVARAQPT